MPVLVAVGLRGARERNVGLLILDLGEGTAVFQAPSQSSVDAYPADDLRRTTRRAESVVLREDEPAIALNEDVGGDESLPCCAA